MLFDLIEPLSLLIGLSIGFCCGFLYFNKNKSSEFRLNKGKSENGGQTREEEPLSYADWGEYKMVMVVRQDLGMGKGKAAAQCCHAAVEVYNRSKKSNPKWLYSWEHSGCPKVALKCPDESTLDALASHARVLNITHCVISDAGRTQIASGSRTVLGLGPAPVELIDKVTGHLKLY